MQCRLCDAHNRLISELAQGIKRRIGKRCHNICIISSRHTHIGLNHLNQLVAYNHTVICAVGIFRASAQAFAYDLRSKCSRLFS